MSKNSIHKLAIFGGKKTINYDFKTHNTIGREEEKAVNLVMKSRILSDFLAAWSKNFYGGSKVKELEKKFAAFFKVKYAVAVNSWTSGLITAVGSLDIEPGDEIITSPFTMCATATAIIHWNCIPIFADIDKKTFCLDPKSVESKINRRTKAILLVDISGHPSDISSFKKIATKYNIKIIIDAAQSIGAKYLDSKKYAGTVGDVGGFSLNYHKHIYSGEGGIIVTNNKKIAQRLCLIRNHGEGVAEKIGLKKINNIVGYNFRMTEIESAIAIEQLKKLPKILRKIRFLANRLTEGLKNLNGLQTPHVNYNCTHSFYAYGLNLDLKKINLKRSLIVRALKAEGLNCTEGYQNIHLLPMYRKKIAYGSEGYPWKFSKRNRSIIYKKGLCPNAERLHEKTYFYFSICNYQLTIQDIDLIIKTFKKVWINLDLLKKIK
jgi:perosamine synthetase